MIKALKMVKLQHFGQHLYNNVTRLNISSTMLQNMFNVLFGKSFKRFHLA